MKKLRIGEMRIKFTNPAKTRLYEIRQYYKYSVSDRISKKIIGDILDSIKILTEYPEIGQIEPTLEELNLKHRRIISGNYKIIYRIEKILFILPIFLMLAVIH